MMNSTHAPCSTNNRNQIGLLYPDGSEALPTPHGKGRDISTPSHWKTSVVTSSPLSSSPHYLPHPTSLLRSQAFPAPTVPSPFPSFHSPPTAEQTTHSHKVSTPPNSDTTPPSYSNYGPAHYYPRSVRPPATTQASSIILNENHPQALSVHGTPTKITIHQSSPLANTEKQSKAEPFLSTSTNVFSAEVPYDLRQSRSVAPSLHNLTTQYNSPSAHRHSPSYQPHFQLAGQNDPVTSTTTLPATIPLTTNGDYNSHSATCGHPLRPMHHRIPLYDISKLLSSGCTIIEGRVYNDKGHNICGVLNQHDKPCKRIGKCPFHTMPTAVTQANSCNGYVDVRGNVAATDQPNSAQKITENVRPLRTARFGEYLPPHWHVKTSFPDGTAHGHRRVSGCEYGSVSSPEESSSTTTTLRACGGASVAGNLSRRSAASAGNGLRPPRKVQYKHGWSKDEHYMFLRGLQKYDRGSWKQISLFVKTRTPTQVQSHAQKYFLRQKQFIKNKRSIHDLSIDSPEMQEVARRLRIDSGPSLNGGRSTRHILEVEGMKLQSDTKRESSNAVLHPDEDYVYRHGVACNSSDQEFPRNFVVSDYAVRGVSHNGLDDMTTRLPSNLNEALPQRHHEAGTMNVQGTFTERRSVEHSWAYNNIVGDRFHHENIHAPARGQELYRSTTEGFGAFGEARINGEGDRIGGTVVASSTMGVVLGQRENLVVGARRFMTGLDSRSPSEMRASQGVAPTGSMSGVGARHM